MRCPRSAATNMLNCLDACRQRNCVCYSKPALATSHAISGTEHCCCCLRLGLRLGEVANLSPRDIDWRSGTLTIRAMKSRRDRVLPLPRDVGTVLVAYLRVQRERPEHIFQPRRPPFTEERRRTHVLNSQRYLFHSVGIANLGSHSFPHTLATRLVSKGASFKAIADVLGHKSVMTTMIYAKLDLQALKQVALPWPGGAR